jgi:cytochrome bd-type quinol oxidase subunit 1
MLPILLNRIASLHFVNLVLLLREKYKFLNSMLETSPFITSNVTNLNDFHTNCITPIEKCTFEMKNFNRDTRETNISTRCNQLHNLRIIYNQLYEVAHFINSTYGISLLCATFWVFICVICGINYVMKIQGTDSSLCVSAEVLWSLFCAALVIIMAVSCSLAVSECNRSPVIVQKIMLRNDIHSEVIKELKKMFSQFKVMKIEFSACGLYKIDLSLLCGIFGVTLSYLIIFWQL